MDKPQLEHILDSIRLQDQKYLELALHKLQHFPTDTGVDGKLIIASLLDIIILISKISYKKKSIKDRYK